MNVDLRDDQVQLPGGPRLAIRTVDGPRRPFLLVHGLASNARLWDGVAAHLAAAGHQVVAVDLRGHGRSERPAEGHTTEQSAADLATLIRELDLAGAREPVAVGQSWGGNVVLTMAARHGGVAALGLVDGGWLSLSDRFATFDECWAALAPPAFGGVTLAELGARFAGWHPDWPAASIEASLANLEERPDGTAVARLAREHHRSIVHSLFVADPRSLYPLVRVPVLLLPAVAAAGVEDDPRAAAPREALAALPDATVRWYVGADHDVHAQHPGEVAADLLALAARAEAATGERAR